MNCTAPNGTSADTIEVLEAFEKVMAKRWLADGTIKGYDLAKQFRRTQFPLEGFDDLAALLQDLKDLPHHCVVRGGLLEGEALEQALARIVKRERGQDASFVLRSGAVLRRGELFRDCPRRWMMIDVDGYGPGVDPIAKPEAACLEFVNRALPPEFRERSFFWSLSGSAGHATCPGVLKAHLWFWLHEPATSAQLRRWASHLSGIDPSVFSPVQVHYTAAPILHLNYEGLVPVRSGVYRGAAGDTVHLDMTAEVRAAVAPSTERRPMQDPGEKPGVLGAFCRTFAPADLLRLLPDVFEQGRDERHFSWLCGEHAPDGIFITECGHGLVSVHATAPSGQGRRVNVFDFIRLHLFGDEDLNLPAETPMFSRPSHRRMLQWIRDNCPEVQADAREANAPDAWGADDDKPNAAELIERLRAMAPNDVAAAWAELSAHLPDSELDVVIDEVRHLTKSHHKRPLNAAAKEARQTLKARAASESMKARIGEREIITYEQESQVRVADLIEEQIARRAPDGAFLDFGGRLSRVALCEMPWSHLVDDDGSPALPVPQIAPLNRVTARALAEAAVVLVNPPGGKAGPLEIGNGLLDILLEKPNHVAPKIAGLVTHPLVLGDGEILSGDGLHALSRLYMQAGAIEGLKAYSQSEAQEALERLRSGFLDGFEFASPLDRDVALAGLFTGVQRRVLPMAPGLHISASGPAQGKTTLARLIYVTLTGHDMPVSVFPERNDGEVAKQLLAMLMRSPPMVCFDNLTEGTTFRSAPLATVLTSSEFVQRELGFSRDAQVPTNVLMVLTGNNVAMGLDHVSRFITARLASAAVRPEERTFSRRDIVAWGRDKRLEVLRDVVGIVAGYLKAGGGQDDRSRFPAWDRMVRQPLLWAGALDVADTFRINAEVSGDTMGKQLLVSLLHEIFGEKEFTARDVANATRHGRSEEPTFGDYDDEAHAERRAQEKDRADGLTELLLTLRATDPTSPTSAGRVIASLMGDRQETEDGRVLTLRARMANHSRRYRVELLQA